MTQPPNHAICFDDAYRRYLHGLLTNDRQQCRDIFDQLLQSGADLRVIYDDFVRRSLYEVGDLWECGQISVATEHLATAITEGLLNLVYPRLFARPRLGKSAIVACAANEYHQIGAKMAADIFELNGWRGYFLGANTPLHDLKNFIAEKQPDLVALSAAVTANLDMLVSEALEIRAMFPGIPILVGGQAFRSGGEARVDSLSGVRYLSSLSQLDAWMKDGARHV